jgi:hypothetical protein
MKKRLRVKVEQGMFSSERAVSFRAGDQNYMLFVDESDVQGDTLEVFVVAERPDEAIIDLPRDTFTSGNRIRVPAGLLIAAE